MHEKSTTGNITLINGSPWYQSYVDYAKSKGIINEDLNWEANATRSGYMAIFAKALPDGELAQINNIVDDAIPDVKMSHSKSAEIYKLYRAGIVQGVDDQKRCLPDSDIKRSEVAAILTRMMDKNSRLTFQMGQESNNELGILVHPQDKTINEGETYTLEVVAKGEGLKYNWQYKLTKDTDWATLKGTHSWDVGFDTPVFTSTHGYSADSKPQYRCMVTDKNGKVVYSDVATITINQKTTELAIMIHPKDKTINEGETYTLEVVAKGEGLKYNWQYKLTKSTDWVTLKGTHSWDVGYDTPVFTSTHGYSPDSKPQYRCMVTDKNGEVVYSDVATITINKKATELAILIHPKDKTIHEGETYTLEVVAKGEGLKYNWQYKLTKDTNWVTLKGTHSWDVGYDTPVFTSTHGYSPDSKPQYRCMITDKNGDVVFSDVATIKIMRKRPPIVLP